MTHFRHSQFYSIALRTNNSFQNAAETSSPALVAHSLRLLQENVLPVRGIDRRCILCLFTWQSSAHSLTKTVRRCIRDVTRRWRTHRTMEANTGGDYIVGACPLCIALGLLNGRRTYINRNHRQHRRHGRAVVFFSFGFCKTKSKTLDSLCPMCASLSTIS